ncbi:MAG: methyltransferase [candidate division WOR-3 bacterium]
MIGRQLFRFRGLIGTMAALLVWLVARPNVNSLLVGLVPIVPGLALRTWAAGYLGPRGRVKTISGGELVSAGPYAVLRHPQYIGNFLLTGGCLLALNPAPIVSASVLVLFVIEYGLIARAEDAVIAACDDSRGSDGQRFRLVHALVERSTLAAVAGVYALCLVRMALVGAGDAPG